MYIAFEKKEKIDYEKLIIPERNDENFWKHHGHTYNDMIIFSEQAKKLEKIIKDMNEYGYENLLREDQKIYNIFFNKTQPIQLFKKDGLIYVEDGRHRMEMCRLLNVNIEFDVKTEIQFELYKQKSKISSFIADLFKKSQEDISTIAVKRTKESEKIFHEIGCSYIYDSTQNFIVVDSNNEIFKDILKMLNKNNLENTIYISKERFSIKEYER